MWEILKYDAPRDLGILLFELSTLVSDTAADVDIEGCIRTAGPDLVKHGVHGEPGELWLAPERHEFVEMVQVFRVVGKPSKCVRGGVPSILEDRVKLVRRILVECLLEEPGQRLILG